MNKQRDKKGRYIKGSKGHLGYKHSNESKELMRIAKLGYKHTQERKDEMSKRMSGERNPFYGKQHPKEIMIKITKAHKGKDTWMKGKHHTKETRELISQNRIGKKLNPKSEAKRIASLPRGKDHWTYGKKRSPKTIRKMVKSLKALWLDEDYVAHQLKMLKMRPNDHELYLDAILQLNFPKEWIYTGDGKQGSFFGKIPDWINCNGRKLIIEYNGYKGHEQHTPEKIRDKTRHYAKYGQHTINIDTKQLNEQKIVNLITKAIEKQDAERTQM